MSTLHCHLTINMMAPETPEALWEAATPVTCGGLACSIRPAETQHIDGSLKDLPAVVSVPKGQGMEGALSGGEKAGE